MNKNNVIKKTDNINNMLKNGIIQYILLAVVIFVSFLLFNNRDIKFIEGIIITCLGAAFVVSFYNKKADTESIITLIIICGIIMRIGYMLYTPMNVRGHDFTGHLSYIKTLFDGALPDSNSNQFYHPPFFHFMGALASKTIGSLKYVGDDIFEAAKLISCFASCVCLIVTKKIAEELNLEKGKILAVAITAFFPNFYLLAGRVNNDSLAIMFMYIAFLYTVRWYKKPCFKNVIVIAFSIGLGMMTKISVGTTALFTGPVMLYVLFKNYKRDKKDLSILTELIVFAVICFPLALWYPFRNMIRFDQPLNYILEPSKDLPFYLGEVSVIERFFSFPIKNLLEPVYNNVWSDKNIWMYMLKGGIFGEFIFEINDFIPRILIIFNLILTIISLAALVYIVINKKTDNFKKYVIGNIWIVTLIFYLYFNISLPFGCTMDFRYAVALVLASSLALGYVYDKLCKSGDVKIKVLKAAEELTVIIFCFYSVLMYVSIN